MGVKVTIIRKFHGNVPVLSAFFQNKPPTQSSWKPEQHTSILGKYSSPSNSHRPLIHNNLELLYRFKLDSHKQINDKP